MQVMGNSKARAVYECNLSENFRRSQTDSYPFYSFYLKSNFPVNLIS